MIHKNFLKKYTIIFLLLISFFILLSNCQPAAEKEEKTDLGDTAWREVGTAGQPLFEGAWSNYSGYSTCAFRKDGQGFVYLKGTVTGGAASQTIFYLPVGYRPKNLLMIVTYGGAVNSMAVIQTDGQVMSGTNYNTFTCLDGVVFHADQ